MSDIWSGTNEKLPDMPVLPGLSCRSCGRLTSQPTKQIFFLMGLFYRLPSVHVVASGDEILKELKNLNVSNQWVQMAITLVFSRRPLK